MFRNYLKIAFRNLARNKMFSFINIFGLALSMSVCLLVLMRIKDQIGYDRFHPNPARTYRIITQVTNKEGATYRLAKTPLPLAPALEKDYHDIDNSVRLYTFGTKRAGGGGKELSVNGSFADAGFFNVFGFELQSGNPATALTAPNSIIISNKTAQRFFGSNDPLGKVIAFKDFGDFIITGVLDQPAGKSHIDFDVFVSMASVPAMEKSGKLAIAMDKWNDVAICYTYVVLKKGLGKKQLASALTRISTTLTKTSDLKGKEAFVFNLQPFNDIILGEELVYNLGNTGSRGKVFAEIGIAFIILLSACFNYTNLSLARSLKRGKEVGIRKVAGAIKFQIFLQFITESIFITLLSLALACGIFQLMIDHGPFTELIPEGSQINLGLVGWFLAFSLFTGLLAGILPAWALSSFKPVEVLKNLSTIKLFGSNGLRKGLIITQFTLSLVIIIFTLTFFKQFNYMAKADPGFDAGNVLSIPLNGADRQLLSNEIAQLKGVEKISATATNIGKNVSGTVPVKINPADDAISMDYYDVDAGFLDMMHLTLVTGKTFDDKILTGKEAQVIISETALKTFKLGNPAEAIGQVLWLDDTTQVQIAGVSKDFYHRGMEMAYRPLLFRNRPEQFNYLDIKTTTAYDEDLVNSIQGTWKKMYPLQPFESSWLKDDLNARYSPWESISMLGFLAIISITLACFGLLGMVIYNTETRKKEIGIRKVMGASVAAIITLLSKNFMRLVVIAGLIALPISYVAGYFFLNMFANRTSMGFGILSLSFIGMLLLSLLVIGSHIYKVAVGNPVVSLRSE